MNPTETTEDLPDLNTNARFKFYVQQGAKFVRRGLTKRFELSDAPFIYVSEVEANEAKRSFKGAILLKEE